MIRGVKGAGVWIRVEDVDLMSFSGITVERLLEKWGVMLTCETLNMLIFFLISP
jgi:hypothetical protein